MTTVRPVWTDEERARILRELTQPSRRPKGGIDGFPQEDMEADLHHICYAYSCRALFPVVWLQLHWGVRPLEVCSLTAENWDSCACTVKIPGAIAKLGEDRQFIADRVTAKMLDAVARGRGRKEILFRGIDGRPWEPSVMAREFSCVLRNIGLHGSLSSLREHAIATLLGFGPAIFVMEITGPFSLGVSDLSGGVANDHQCMTVLPDDQAIPPPTTMPVRRLPGEGSGKPSDDTVVEDP